MNFRLIAFALISTAFMLSSCEEEVDATTNRYYENVKGTMSGAQVRPMPSNTTATGTIVGTYDKKSKSYNYSVLWQNLSSNVTAIHIHGIADTGFVALPSPLGPHTNGIIHTVSGNPAYGTKSGSYAGTLYIDGTVIKEENFLAGKYYIDIHTVNFPVTTLGEIRGQIQFQ